MSLGISTKLHSINIFFVSADALCHFCLEKLTRENFLLWQALILPTVGESQMLGLLNGMFASPAKTIEVENSDKIREVMESLACVNWLSQDQQLLILR
jgi:hypothetical protein